MPKITLILHNIRSTHNVGSIFRTAEGFGVSKIILSGYTPYPTFSGDKRLPHIAQKLTSQIHKTALGAEELVSFEYVETLDSWLDKNTLPLFALEQAPTSVQINTIALPNTFALLLGEEVHGIEKQYLEKCDTIVEIPMVGQKESFNVSVATGIAIYALTIGAPSIV
jgi:23S rRNA (guanosine2251-2'-O)-methyltransferase